METWVETMLNTSNNKDKDYFEWRLEKRLQNAGNNKADKYFLSGDLGGDYIEC